MVEVTVYPPDSKVFARTQIPMKANEFRQVRLLRALGLGDTYNARVTVKFISGQGKVTRTPRSLTCRLRIRRTTRRSNDRITATRRGRNDNAK